MTDPLTATAANSENSAGRYTKRKGYEDLLNAFAKKAVFKLLKNLQIGRLVIEDNHETHIFGDTENTLSLCACMSIHDPKTYQHILRGGSIGGAEAYMLGGWSTPNLLNVIRLMAKNISVLNKVDENQSWVRKQASKIYHFMNRNSFRGSQKNIAAHYDLGNEFFGLFLDSSMMYSSAIYPHAETTLEQAAQYKLDTVCKKLRLNEKDHLLEIGTGWGGLAIYAAKHYGCHVTTTTISKEQYEYTQAAIKRAGLEQKVTLLLKDYRELSGKFDKLVSIEMIEAVGYKFYKSYFQQCSQLLNQDGLMLIQAITIADQRFENAKKSVDFIQRYIFPGGSLPSNEIIAACVSRHTDMMIVNHQDIGQDYAKTLNDWHTGFHEKLDSVKGMGFDDTFCRMWEYYLHYCEGGFLERAISAAQIVMAKPDARQIHPLA